jgi:hypothetical protein
MNFKLPKDHFTKEINPVTANCLAGPELFIVNNLTDVFDMFKSWVELNVTYIWTYKCFS